MNEKIYTSLDEAVRDLFGNGRKITDRRAVHGGDINDAAALLLDDGTPLFMKSNRASALPGFEAEAAGLEAIQKTGAIRTPAVFGLGIDGAGSFLLLEFVSEGRRSRDCWEVFAAQLAAMHAAPTKMHALPTAPDAASTDALNQFGFPSDNFIGSTKQINTPHESWISFYRDCRLEPQFAMAESWFDKEERRRIRSLLDHLDRYLAEPARPSLVHGDLWAGNVITGADGKIWLIDPAVYSGHPEVDIAMTEMFGGFPYSFYEAYREAGHLDSGYADRRDLYDLYQLLNHLNLFGVGYLGAVRRIIKKYT